MKKDFEKQMPTTGYFVDWDGFTRKIEAPGDGYSCNVVDQGHYKRVDVIDPAGFVTHEATYFASLDAVRDVGCTVQMHDEPKRKQIRP